MLCRIYGIEVLFRADSFFFCVISLLRNLCFVAVFLASSKG